MKSHPHSCLHCVPPESTADILTQQQKKSSSLHTVGSLCPSLPIELGLFSCFNTLQNHHLKLYLSTFIGLFTSPCVCVFICLYRTHAYILHIYKLYAHVCKYIHKYLTNTHVFQLLNHIYLLGSRILHYFIFIFNKVKYKCILYENV